MRSNRAHSYGFLAGVAGGLIGTAYWPTGLLVWMMVSGNARGIQSPIVMFLACCFVASLLGGFIATILSVGFHCRLEHVGAEMTLPAPNKFPMHAIKLAPRSGCE